MCVVCGPTADLHKLRENQHVMTAAKKKTKKNIECHSILPNLLYYIIIIISSVWRFFFRFEATDGYGIHGAIFGDII